MAFQELVRALAQQLEPILPAGISVRSDDRNVILRTRYGDDWLNVVDNIEANMTEGATVHEAVQIAVGNKLEELQDMVTEHLTVPWPQRSRMGPSEFVKGEVEVIGGVLQIWFGERDAPLPADRGRDPRYSRVTPHQYR
jgi:hypothetical protein